MWVTTFFKSEAESLGDSVLFHEEGGNQLHFRKKLLQFLRSTIFGLWDVNTGVINVYTYTRLHDWRDFTFWKYILKPSLFPDKTADFRV